MSATSAVLQARLFAEALMGTTVEVTRVSIILDETTGIDTRVVASVWSGPCRLRFPFVRPSEQSAVSQTFAEQRGILSVPIVGTEAIQTNDIATITVSPLDAGMVGRVYRVMGPFDETYATARRLPVQVVS